MRRPFTDYRHIVWDWNGTLLDDTWLCCESLNLLLAEDGREPVDPKRYRQIFEFPVIKVYQAIGFAPNEEAFRALSVRFMRAYELRKAECTLHHGAVELIDALKMSGKTHSILSAYEHDLLESTLSGLGLHGRFSKLCGGEDIHAGSKEDRAKVHLHDLGVKPEDTLYVGDTTHDLEAARAMGVDCLLIAHGHQHRSKLEGHGVPVVDNFAEITHE
ncbi:MAG TPA: phosphoglycolate phosphatase [Opitutae bacterium]|nr:phosphoglycolate phosphatase [Opitutae bacterium]